MQSTHSEFLKKTFPVWSLRKNEGASISFGLAQEVEIDACAGDDVASALSSDSCSALTKRTGVCRLNVTSCCVLVTVSPWLLAQPRTSLRSFLPPQERRNKRELSRD